MKMEKHEHGRENGSGNHGKRTRSRLHRRRESATIAGVDEDGAERGRVGEVVDGRNPGGTASVGTTANDGGR